MEVTLISDPSKLFEGKFETLVRTTEGEILDYVCEGKQKIVKTLLRRIYSVAEMRSESAQELLNENKRVKQSNKMMKADLDREVRKVGHYDNLMDFMRSRLLRRDARSAQERKVMIREVIELRSQLYRAIDLGHTLDSGLAFPLCMEDMTKVTSDDTLHKEREEEVFALEQLKEAHLSQVQVIQLQLEEEVSYRERLMREADSKLREEMERNKQQQRSLETLQIAAIDDAEQSWIEKMDQIQFQLTTVKAELKCEIDKTRILEYRIAEREEILKEKNGELADCIQEKHLLKNVIHRLQSAIDSAKLSDANVTAGQWARLVETQVRDETEASIFKEIVVHHKEKQNNDEEIKSMRNEIEIMTKNLAMKEDEFRAATCESANWRRKSQLLTKTFNELEAKAKDQKCSEISQLESEIDVLISLIESMQEKKQESSQTNDIFYIASRDVFLSCTGNTKAIQQAMVEKLPIPDTIPTSGVRSVLLRTEGAELLRIARDDAVECILKDELLRKNILKSTWDHVVRSLSYCSVCYDVKEEPFWMTEPSTGSRQVFQRWLKVLLSKQLRKHSVEVRERHCSESLFRISKSCEPLKRRRSSLKLLRRSSSLVPTAPSKCQLRATGRLKAVVKDLMKPPSFRKVT